ncbi:hypothetical protein ACWKSP_11265 [Micromonosporaceae bacterium Da 78-11]
MTMQRARRLASVAVVASLAVTGLSACRNAPDVAAYIGAGAQSTKVSQTQVDDIFDDARAKQTPARTAADGTAQKPTAITRQQIVSALVGVGVLRKYGEENNIKPQSFPAESVASAIFLEPDAKYVPIYSEFEGYLEAIAAKVQPVQITEPDVRDVYNRLRAGGSLPETTTFESFAGGLGQQDQQILSQRISLSKALQATAAKLDIDVNPRYSPWFTVLESQSPAGAPIAIVVVPVGSADNSVPVTDLS